MGADYGKEPPRMSRSRAVVVPDKTRHRPLLNQAAGWVRQHHLRKLVPTEAGKARLPPAVGRLEAFESGLAKTRLANLPNRTCALHTRRNTSIRETNCIRDLRGKLVIAGWLDSAVRFGGTRQSTLTIEASQTLVALIHAIGCFGAGSADKAQGRTGRILVVAAGGKSEGQEQAVPESPWGRAARPGGGDRPPRRSSAPILRHEESLREDGSNAQASMEIRDPVSC